MVHASWAFAASRAGPEQPNIVFLLADDQCYETLSALGHPQVRTPNLDRLVRNGLTFTHAYNMGSWSGAVCIASRTMLNTGRFLWHAHAVEGQLESEREAGRLWSQHFRGAGYRTYMTGKWHLSCRADAAFDVVQHLRPGMPNQTPEGYNRPLGRSARPLVSVRSPVWWILEGRTPLERSPGRRCTRLPARRRGA